MPPVTAKTQGKDFNQQLAVNLASTRKHAVISERVLGGVFNMNCHNKNRNKVPVATQDTNLFPTYAKSSMDV